MSDFSSGHDLTVREFEPHIGLTAVSPELAWDPLSSPLSAPPQLAHALSLTKINIKKSQRNTVISPAVAEGKEDSKVGIGATVQN